MTAEGTAGPSPAASERRLRAAYRKHVTERWAAMRERSSEWLRAATFGGLDGLVSNTTLVAASAATGAAPSAVALTGLLGTVSGAASMAGGEYFSVSVDNERRRNATTELRRRLRDNPDGVHEELAELLMAKHASMTHDQARAMADELWSNPELGEYTHISYKLEELPEDGPSPRAAAGASFASFAVGSLLPVGAYALGSMVPGGGIVATLAAGALGNFGAGALTSKFNQGCWWKLGLKQLALGSGATALGYAAGLSFAATLPMTAAVGAAAIVGLGSVAVARRYLARRRSRRKDREAREAYEDAYFKATGALPPPDEALPSVAEVDAGVADVPGVDGPSGAQVRPVMAQPATARRATANAQPATAQPPVATAGAPGPGGPARHDWMRSSSRPAAV